MASLLGIELQRCDSEDPPQGRFLRAIRFDTTVFLRAGITGTPGSERLIHHDTPEQASQELGAAIQRAKTERYRLVFAGPLVPYPAVTYPEATFLDQWRAAVIEHAGGPTRHTWVLVRRATGARANLWGTDPGSAAFVDYLKAAPHAINQDAMVAQVGVIPDPDTIGTTNQRLALNLDPVSPRITTQLLGPIDDSCPHGAPACAPCSKRQAELLEFLCRDRYVPGMPWAERLDLVHASRRLVTLAS